ncbi:MAG: lipoyl(octanoyl) transferase LipB [Proteobacteria bacterium]|nr:lipoyl(octanoyl) transferase LipB [Pseudomonadota bacterium]
MIVRQLQSRPYLDCWQDMKRFTDARDIGTPDELWCVEHPAVFTLGQAGRPEHLLSPGNIDVIRSDRGGQVTYHGPGQLVGYLMVDVRRMGWGVRQLVREIEAVLVATLADIGIVSEADEDAHGVYVEGRKIASLGLRIRRGCSYHGFSLNMDIDLEPFGRINPCGFPGLEVTSIATLLGGCDRRRVVERVCHHVMINFGYDECIAAIETP